ncbi:right-handed parallel beta-helix repeat-containing protein [Chloroflexota bacterium]
MKRLLAIFLAVVLTVGLSNDLSPARLAMAQSVYEVPSTYITIQSAIDATPDEGGMVKVAAGTYNEDIVMKHNVIIKGSGASVTTINGTGTDSVVKATQSLGSAAIDGFTITNGKAVSFGGGGISLDTNASPLISNCIITDNEAQFGGGILLYLNSSPTIVNCIIAGNKATGSSPFGGGGILVLSSSPRLINCTITGNSAVYGGGMHSLASSPTVINSIIWGNRAPNGADVLYPSGTPTFSFSDIGGFGGDSNIDDNPLFVDPEGDYHLYAEPPNISPCIDTGTNDDAPPFDLDNVARPQPVDGRVDMGAYEYSSSLEYTLTVITDGNGSVSVSPSGPYNYNDVVTLNASASTGWVFSGWSGDLSSSTNPDTITINGDKTVTATFTELEYTLTVITDGNGSVSVSPSGPYNYNDVVTLNASASTGWVFSGWSGDLSSSTNPDTITINGDKTVTATFTELVIEVKVDIKPGSDPNSINLRSKGVIPVAILTANDFDASDIDPDTVAFGPSEAVPTHFAIEDVDGDGDDDMILHFETQEVGLSVDDTEATITGQTLDGISIEGADTVRITPNNKNSQGGGQGQGQGKGSKGPK